MDCTAIRNTLQGDCGLLPKVGVQRLPWVRVRKWEQRQRRCDRGQARGRERMGRNRVAAGEYPRQNSIAYATKFCIEFFRQVAMFSA